MRQRDFTGHGHQPESLDDDDNDFEEPDFASEWNDHNGITSSCVAECDGKDHGNAKSRFDFTSAGDHKSKLELDTDDSGRLVATLIEQPESNKHMQEWWDQDEGQHAEERAQPVLSDHTLPAVLEAWDEDRVNEYNFGPRPQSLDERDLMFRGPPPPYSPPRRPRSTSPKRKPTLRGKRYEQQLRWLACRRSLGGQQR